MPEAVNLKCERNSTLRVPALVGCPIHDCYPSDSTADISSRFSTGHPRDAQDHCPHVPRSAANTRVLAITAPKAETKSKPKGGANPAVQRAANRGSTLHSDKPGHLPEQLREKYPETEFKFNKPGQSGQDVSVQGGKHPSEYSDSAWKADANHGDFKPDTSTGKKTFEADQKKKWKEKTQMLPYDPRRAT